VELDFVLLDKITESIDVGELAVLLVLDGGGLLHVLTVIHEVLHEIVAAVRNRPVQLVVVLVHDLEKFGGLMIENLGELHEDLVETVLGAVFDHLS